MSFIPPRGFGAVCVETYSAAASTQKHEIVRAPPRKLRMVAL